MVRSESFLCTLTTARSRINGQFYEVQVGMKELTGLIPRRIAVSSLGA